METLLLGCSAKLAVEKAISMLEEIFFDSVKMLMFLFGFALGMVMVCGVVYLRSDKK